MDTCPRVEIYEGPVAKNASLGSSVTFSCNISGNTGISWLVDGTSHYEVSIMKRGISSQDYYNEASDSTKSILTVTCEEQNNNTLLQCIGYSNGQLAQSSEVLLRIQGHSFLLLHILYYHRVPVIFRDHFGCFDLFIAYYHQQMELS